MTIDVTTSEDNQDYFIGNIPLINTCKLNASHILTIGSLGKEFGGGIWLYESIRLSKLEMDNCDKRLIREAEEEIKKAKEFLKVNYPIKYKLSYYKVILKNPIKTLIAKWLLRSK
jgi:hypothetical protein